MAANKTERLLEVFLCLSQSQRPVTKRQLREVIEDYATATSDEAFEKTFERDKAELRDLGVPLETISSGDDEGYRVDLATHILPPVQFTAAEAALLGLARRVWHTEAAGAADRALRKLEAAGASVDPGALTMVEPRLTGGEQAFGPIAQAASQRQVVRFEHRASGATTTTARRVCPYGVVSRNGRWYVVGHDLDRDDRRAFRLDRIVGPVTSIGPEAAFEIPSEVDVASLVGDPSAPHNPRTAVLLLRRGTGHGLRAEAASIEAQSEVWDRLTISTTGVSRLVRDVLSLGADVVVLEPEDVKDAVSAALTRVIGAGTP